MRNSDKIISLLYQMNLTKVLIFSVAFPLLIGCNKSNNQDRPTPLQIDEHLQEKLSEYTKLSPYYRDDQFKNEILERLIQRDRNIIKRIEQETSMTHYSIILDSLFLMYMDEPILSKSTSKRHSEVYRLRVSNELKSQIEIIRIDNSNNLTYKKYHIDSSCNPVYSNKNWEKSCFKIVEKINRKIQKNEWDDFNKIIREIKFWSISSYEIKPNCMDGDNWQLEGSWDYNYNRIDVHCPGKYDLVKILGEKLFELTKRDK